MISHGNYRAMLDMVNETSVIEDEDVTYLYLPLAHSFALLIQLGSFDLGATLAYWERDPLKILPNLAELKPTYFPSVPRIFEKIYTAATSGMEKEGGLKKAIFDWSIRVGKKMREAERSGRKPGFLLRKQYEFADKQVLSKIRGLFGGRLRLAVSGAAPINPEILRFFDAAGVLVLEGWGMTETSTAATISTAEDFKVGTIGKPFPGCEVRIADDGEILVKGPNVFQGYYKNEEATRETIVDGWLHTGDIGEIDADGFIKITGRKKDIIITAGGKNITPANLENEIKQHPLVSQCVVVGDRRPYLVALVTLDPEEAVAYAKEHGLPEDPEQLAANAEVRAAIEAHVEKINEKFARVEQVKKIAILPHDLSQESGELTPTLKVKRAVVASKHEPEIEELYVGELARPRPGLAEQRRGRLLEHPAPGRGLLRLLLGGPLDHAADAALGDLEAVALGDLLVAVVVLGQGRGHRFEAVAGDLQPPRVVHDRRAEHQLVVGLGLDQDDVDARVASPATARPPGAGGRGRSGGRSGWRSPAGPCRRRAARGCRRPSGSSSRSR